KGCELMRVLITGCQGQIGCYLTEQLNSCHNHTVLALARNDLDITDRGAVNAVVAEFRPTIIINAAAYTAVDQAEVERELAYAVNRDGAKFLAEAAQQVGAAILHISTDYVFDGSKDGEYLDTDVTMPLSVYGASKLAGEQAVAQACTKHIILRTSWAFGVYGHNFVKTMLRLGASRDSVSIVDDQFGGPTYAGDIAQVLISMAMRIAKGDVVEYGVYHYSGMPYVSWYEFTAIVLDAAYAQGVITVKPHLERLNSAQYPTLAQRPKNSRLDSTNIRTHFGIEPSDWLVALQSLERYV
ncbi:MAG: dTDP-4-dehydrorhamnose reductase, partial [Shewanella sp.]